MFIYKLKNYRNIKHSNEEGFTLIELMIVVVIIGILAAIAIPIFANQQKAATLATVKSDLNTARTAVTTWMTKNNGKIPTKCTEINDLLTSIPLSKGNIINYYYSTKKADTYYIRVSQVDTDGLDSNGDPISENRYFYVNTLGKIVDKSELVSLIKQAGPGELWDGNWNSYGWTSCTTPTTE